MWVAPDGLASAPHPPANRGGAVGGAAAASPEPPGLDDLKRAILQRVGRSPEQHRQRFRSLELGENGQPFVMAHQLRDACRRWLLAGEGGVDQIIDRVVLEQFIARLSKKTAQWVQCHRPASLDLAIQLAEDQMVVCHEVGGEAWAGLLALRGPGPLHRSVSSDGGGDTGPGSGRPTGCPRSSWWVPNTCEY